MSDAVLAVRYGANTQLQQIRYIDLLSDRVLFYSCVRAPATVKADANLFNRKLKTGQVKPPNKAQAVFTYLVSLLIGKVARIGDGWFIHFINQNRHLRYKCQRRRIAKCSYPRSRKSISPTILCSDNY